MGWNPLKTVGDILGGGKAQTVKPITTNLDAGLFGQLSGDIGNIRNTATGPVTSLNASGKAAQDYANTAYQNQLNQLGMQGQSALASSMANTARYGMDSGGAERMSRQNMMQGMLGQQNLGSANMENMANIGQQNLAMQEQHKYGAMMALPQLQQSQMMSKYNADSANAELQNQANLANMSAKAARGQAIGNSLGTIGQIGGSVFGGPVGGVIGGMGGKALGGLFG